MKKTNNIPTSSGPNFWFGFALGSISVSALAYLLGTKKGRETLKTIIEYADNAEDLSEEIINLLPLITRGQESEESPHSQEDTTMESADNSINSIMEKMKSNIEKKQSKKFFVKG